MPHRIPVQIDLSLMITMKTQKLILLNLAGFARTLKCLYTHSTFQSDWDWPVLKTKLQ